MVESRCCGERCGSFRRILDFADRPNERTSNGDFTPSPMHPHHFPTTCEPQVIRIDICLDRRAKESNHFSSKWSTRTDRRSGEEQGVHRLRRRLLRLLELPTIHQEKPKLRHSRREPQVQVRVAVDSPANDSAPIPPSLRPAQRVEIPFLCSRRRAPLIDGCASDVEPV